MTRNGTRFFHTQDNNEMDKNNPNTFINDIHTDSYYERSHNFELCSEWSSFGGMAGDEGYDI